MHNKIFMAGSAPPCLSTASHNAAFHVLDSNGSIQTVRQPHWSLLQYSSSLLISCHSDFMPLITGSTYLNLVGVACCVLLLLSFAVLSVEYTNRHYLSVCLVTAILILQVCKIQRQSPAYELTSVLDVLCDTDGN